MRNTLSVLCCALLCTIAYAQKPPIKFGDIPMEDMKMTVYPLDSGAAAVVLADFGESKLEYHSATGFQIHFERIRRVKILKKEGLQYAEFGIPLYSAGGNDERISALKLATYNLENGKIVETKVKSENFFREEVSKNVTLTKCAWTNVKEGSIIEITYKVASDFVFNFQDWEFQTTIPTRWSEYRARIPEYYNYQKFMQGYIGLVVNETKPANNSITFTGSGGQGMSSDRLDFQEEHFRWAAKDVPAFKEEPFLTTANDYISKINFELSFTKFPNQPIKNYMGSWEDINKSYWEAVKSEINSNAGLKDDVERILAGAATPEEKVGKIFNYVRSNIMWDERSRLYADNTPRKIADLKKGSSADINLLLACMLDKAGFPVNPVLLSTRNHGFVRQVIPISSQFNYMVCMVKIGDKSALLDATDRMLPFGALPERCLNGTGLAITADGPVWINLAPTLKSRTVYSADVALDPTGEIKGTLRIDKSGYHSARARRQYHSKGEAEYVKDFAKNPSWTVSDSKFENANDINLPFKELHQVAVTEAGTTGADIIYLNPFMFGREAENPFKSETREYPVDFGNPFEQIYTAKIAVPEGYVVEELPPSKVIGLPENAARYMLNVSQQGNTINITSGLYVNRSIFTQDVYPNLREFYNQMIAKQAEQIVLKKK